MVASLASLQAQLAKVGEDSVLQKQKEKQDEALSTFKSMDFSALSPSAIKSQVSTATSEVTGQVTAGIDKATSLAPKLTSLTLKLMQGVNEKDKFELGVSLLDSLQDLTNNLKILPPGAGLPNIGGGLDIAKTALGGMDISSVLSVADIKLGEPSIDTVAALLPDIGAGADILGFKVPGGITEGISGALVNPFKTFGNKFIKDTFDKFGNPTQEILKKGVPCVVPRVDARAEEAPLPWKMDVPPSTIPTKLPKIFEL
jgi:hypothetical protein